MNEQQLFEYVKKNMLKDMPAGMLVTKNNITFDIGHWQHRAYEDNNNIDAILKRDRCSTLINLMILDKTITQDQLFKFIDDIDLSIRGRNIHLIYFLSIHKPLVTEGMFNKLKYRTLNINRFSKNVEVEQDIVFENEFISDLKFI